MLQQLLVQRRLLQKVAEITLVIKGIIQAVMKESQYAVNVVIEIHMTRTANEDSPRIYTLGVRRRTGGQRDHQHLPRREEKKEEIRP